MVIKRRFYTTIFLAFVILILSACNPDPSNEAVGNEIDETEEGSDKSHLIVGTTSEPSIINPFYSTDTPSRTLQDFVLSTLVTVDTEFNPEGDLAKEWDVSEDGKTFTFYLHEDVKWHDGEPFTADDIVFTYNIPLDEDYDGPRASTYEGIEEIKKLDDYTVEFTLKQPSAPFLPIAMNMGILPEHVLGDVPISELGEHEFNTKSPIGTGPFVFDKWSEGEYVRFEAFEDYHLGAPKIDILTYKIVPDSNALMAQLQTGDVNFAGISTEHIDSAEEMAEEGLIKLQSGEDNAWEYIIWNLRDPLFEDLKVRQALTHALDRETMIEAVVHGQGTVAHAPGSPANWAFNPDTVKYEYDPDKAQELLKEAGWEDGNDDILEKNGEKFTFTIKTSEGESREKMAAVIQQQLSEIGVDVDIEVMEFSAFIEDTGPPNWNFDAQVSGMSIGSDPDPKYFWHSDEIDNGLNYGAYSNEKVDDLLEKQKTEMDQDKRYEMIKEADAIVAEELPVTFLYYPYGHLGHDPELNGPIYNPANTYYDIHNWSFE